MSTKKLFYNLLFILTMAIVIMCVFYGMPYGTADASPKSDITTLASINRNLPEGSQSDTYEAVCSIPVGGDTGLHYKGVGVPEMQAWGPAAFTMDAHGNFWIADTAANRIQQYGPNCDHITTINLGENVVGITDLELTQSDLWTLDGASPTPRVLRLSESGQELESVDIQEPVALGLSGIAADDRGLLIEREGGADVKPLTDFFETETHNKKLYRDESESGYVFGGNRYQVRPADPSAIGDAARSASLRFAGGEVSFQSDGKLGGLHILGSTGNQVYAVAEAVELDDTGRIRVDQTVRRYSKQGEFLGVARVSLQDRFVHTDHALALGKDGNVYTLTALEDRFEIRRLAFFKELPSVLSGTHESTQSVETSAAGEVTIQACNITRDTIMANARAYINNSKYLSDTNINGSCSGRGKPRYLGWAGT